ncbi:cell division protein FtsA [Moraxella nasovis]|uniref:cell division protein FtsA n=1 Tax=Moraxella nasovis TaxID=2904121 RepID=UPI001F5FFCA5|nr:cell division protein FtsA [Moraxella nasovis]UNU73765.1 cell division protein FtsA [Moraxella nasovis]
MMQNLKVAIHLSSTAVYTAVGCFDGSPENRRVKVAGVGLAHTDGFFQGRVEHRDHLLGAISKSVQEACDMAGVQVYSACLSFASSGMKSSNSSCSIVIESDITDELGKVEKEHILAAYDRASQKLYNQDRSLFQMIRQCVYVDGQVTKDAVGMLANKIKVASHVISLPKNYHGQIQHVIEPSGFEVEAMLFDGVVSAEYALTKEEREQGVCFIDIGAGTTKVCVYYQGVLLFTHCLDMGGHAVTLDIASELGLSPQDAERLKIQHGGVVIEPADRATFITYKKSTGDEVTISLHRLMSIIEARYHLIFDELAKVFDEQGLFAIFGSNIVLAGEATKAKGLSGFLAKKWSVAARRIEPNKQVSVSVGAKGLSDEQILSLQEHLKSTKLHSVIGSLMYQQSEQFMRDDSASLYYFEEKNGVFDKVVQGWKSFTQNIKNWV